MRQRTPVVAQVLLGHCNTLEWHQRSVNRMAFAPSDYEERLRQYAVTPRLSRPSNINNWKGNED